MKNKINYIQYSILDRLFFTEPFSRLLEELNEPRNVLAAELKDLIVKGFVQSMEYDNQLKLWKRSLYYDSDNMNDYQYRATGKGIEAYENFKQARFEEYKSAIYRDR